MDGAGWEHLHHQADGAARGTEHNLERAVWASKVSLILLQELFQAFPVSPCIPAGPGSPGFGGKNSPAVLDPDIPGGTTRGRAGMGGRSSSPRSFLVCGEIPGFNVENVLKKKKVENVPAEAKTGEDSPW